MYAINLKLLVKVAVWLFFAFITATCAANTPLLYLDYENDSVTSHGSGVSVKPPKFTRAITIDCTVARSGRCALRSMIDDTDEYVSYGAHRAESDTEHSLPVRYIPNDCVRYRFSLFLPKDWEIDSRKSEDIIWQFKHFSAPPDVFIAVKGRDIVIRSIGGIRKILIADYPRGEWLDFQLDIRWAVDNAGLVKVKAVRKDRYKDAATTAEIQGRNMADKSTKGGYLKWGIYKPNYQYTTTRQPRSVIHDAISVESMNQCPRSTS